REIEERREERRRSGEDAAQERDRRELAEDAEERESRVDVLGTPHQARCVPEAVAGALERLHVVARGGDAVRTDQARELRVEGDERDQEREPEQAPEEVARSRERT